MIRCLPPSREDARKTAAAQVVSAMLTPRPAQQTVLVERRKLELGLDLRPGRTISEIDRRGRVGRLTDNPHLVSLANH
jgi:hypothetical protein